MIVTERIIQELLGNSCYKECQQPSPRALFKDCHQVRDSITVTKSVSQGLLRGVFFERTTVIKGIIEGLSPSA